MKKHYLLLVVILLILLNNQTFAQKKWSLAECVDYAISNNLNVKKADINEQSANERYQQSHRDMMPSFGLSSNAGINYGRSVDPNTNGIINTSFFNNSISAGSNLTVFNGFRMLNLIKYEKYRMMNAKQTKQKLMDDLAFEVMSSYFDILYYKEMMIIADEQVKTSQLHVQRAERNLAEGLKSQSDILEMKANLEMEELRRVQCENKLSASILVLQQLMNYTENIDPTLLQEVEMFDIDVIPPANKLFDEFLGWSPRYQVVCSNLQLSERYLSIMRSGLFPSISVSYAAGSGYYETNKDQFGKIIPYTNQFSNNFSQYIGASLNVPLFSRWSNRSNIKLAKLSLEQSKYDVKSEEQKIMFEISRMLNDIAAFKKEYAQQQQQLKVDSLALQIADKKMAQGLTSIIDYYMVKNRVANASINVIRSELQLEFNRRMLHFYEGKRFW